MGCWADCVGRARLFLSTLVLTFVLGSSLPAAGAPAPGFPLLSSPPSPVTGAVTISAPAVLPEAGLAGVQFKVDGYVLNALDTTSPFQVIWSAASASNGNHTLTAEARLTSGVVIQSAPLVLTVANPTTFNRLFHVDAGAGNDGSNGLTASTAWRTLDRANSAVTAGDTVLLRGTFSGQFIQPNASGTAAQPIRFMSDPGQLAVLDNSGIRLTGRQFVVVEDVLIRNYPGQAAVIEDSNFNAIRGSQFLNIGNGSGAWGHAIRITRSSDNVVEQNRITNIGNESENTGDSIYIVSGAHRNRILGNTLQNGGHSLIQIGSQQSTAVAFDNVIAGNTLSNFYATGIILAYGNERTLIEYNRISDAGRNGVNYPRAGIQIQAPYNIVRYNEVFDNSSSGLHLGAYTYAGTIPQDSIGNQIYHNVFYGNNRIQDFQNNSGAIHFRESDGRSVRDNLIANNIFFRNNGFQQSGQFYTITITHYGNPTSWPVGSLNGNRIQNNIVLRQPGSAGEVTVLRIRDGSQGGNLSYTLDGQVLGMLSPAAMTFAWNTAAVSNGAHTLTARAYDAAGNATTSTGINVTVANADTTAPTVAITTPTASPTYTASSSALALGGTAADNVGVTQVTWANDRGGTGTATGTATGTTSWTAGGIVLQAGANLLTVTARDAAGTIATRTMTVTYAAATAPTVAITTPTASPTYSTTLASLSLGGTASAATQVTWANDHGHRDCHLHPMIGHHLHDGALSASRVSDVDARGA